MGIETVALLPYGRVKDVGSNPAAGRSGIEEFCKRRIPGAKFFDIDKVADVNTDLPHMLPSSASFAAAADALGITNSSTVVLYDGLGIFSAPRAWFTFRAYGHDRYGTGDIVSTTC